jgi:hypothetical protein
MASKKSKSSAAAAKDIPSIADPKEAALAVLSLQTEVGPQESITPCLVGPTGSGKTTLAQGIAEHLGLPLVEVPIGSALPEDVLGMPRTDDQSVIRYRRTEWAERAIREPVLLFGDEADKVRPETLSRLATLLASRTVFGEALHPGTRIVLAMQPVDTSMWLAHQTGRAISARCCWIEVCGAQRATEYIRSKTGLTVEPVFASEEVALPVLDGDSPRLRSWAAQAMLRYREQPALAWTLWRGVFGDGPVSRARWSEVMEQTASRTSTIAVIDEDTLAATHQRPDLLDCVPHSVLIAAHPQIVQHASLEAYLRWLIRLQDADKDTQDAAQKSLQQWMQTLQDGQEIQIFGPGEPDEATIERLIGMIEQRIEVLRTHPDWEYDRTEYDAH